MVSSVTPLISAAIRVNRCGSSSSERCEQLEHDRELLGVGGRRVRARRRPPRTRRPCGRAASRRRRRRGSCSGPSPSGQLSACSVHHQYSSSVSPFHAKTGTPRGSSGVPSGPTTTAAAAWSWVEKMLQRAQRTSAPSATSVSISTAVWIVMCSEPVIRAPVSGWRSAYSRRIAIRPGHLVLGQLDLLAAERGQRQVGDLEVGLRQRSSLMLSPSCRVSCRRLGRQARQPAASRACPARSAASPRRRRRRAAWPRLRATPRPPRAARHRSAIRAANATSERPTSKRASSSLSVRRRCSCGGAVQAVAGRRPAGETSPVCST